MASASRRWPSQWRDRPGRKPSPSHVAAPLRGVGGSTVRTSGAPPLHRRQPPQKNDAVAIPAGQVFEYSNLTAEQCANLLWRHTGTPIMLAPGTERVEVKLRPDGPLTNGEVARILEFALEMRGLFFKEFAPGEQVIFPINPLVTRQAAENPGPVRVRRVPSR